MIYTLERFEGELAILLDDNKEILSINKALLGDFAQIGNIFESNNKADFKFLDNETKNRKISAISLHRSLFNKQK